MALYSSSKNATLSDCLSLHDSVSIFRASTKLCRSTNQRTKPPHATPTAPEAVLRVGGRVDNDTGHWVRYTPAGDATNNASQSPICPITLPAR